MPVAANLVPGATTYGVDRVATIGPFPRRLHWWELEAEPALLTANTGGWGQHASALPIAPLLMALIVRWSIPAAMEARRGQRVGPKWFAG